MEFMDPKERRKHDLMLLVGYVLIGCAVLLLTTIVIFVAYGFGFQHGQVVQSGIVFVSSTPRPATIYVNGAGYKNSTNTNIVLPSGTYNLDLHRDGYRDWQRTILVEGGQATRYAYPFLFPSSLTTTTLKDYPSKPLFVTLSVDRRWLVLGRPEAFSSFDVYDLKNPKKMPTLLTLPSGLLSNGGAQSLEVVEWSKDDDHLLLSHSYDGNVEFILLSRTNPEQSLNLSRTLALPAKDVQLNLNNKNYDQYIVFNTEQQAILRASLSSPTLRLSLSKVLAFKAYGDNAILYATPDTTTASNKVAVDLYDGQNTYTIRRMAANTTYLLDAAQHGGNLYVVAGASSENVTYVYENPIDQITNKQLGIAVPIRALRLNTPNYLSFSPDTQYVVVENGSNFAVYDIENQQGSAYNVPMPFDTSQMHAVWMDAAHLLYISGGQIIVSDYDGTNRQILVSADPEYSPAFDGSYKSIYVLTPSASNSTHELLTITSLRIPADQ